MLRSARLEGILGTQLDSITAGHIERLVTDGVGEAFDLDFKQTLYGRSEADKRALAGDVAALASTAGGLLLLGVQEDAQARASATPGVALSDEEDRRMRQVIAAGVAPVPEFDIITVPSSADPASGFYVIAVQRTQAAPHAVIVNEGYRYPRRNGASIRYLSEPEVAEAYRARLQGLGIQSARVRTVWMDGLKALRADEVWVTAALVPDVPGTARVDRAATREWERTSREQAPTVIQMGFQTLRTFVGRGYLGADGSSGAGPSRWFRLEQHSDGAGFFAIACGWPRRNGQGEDLDPPEFAVDDEHLCIGVLSALVRLSKHARATATSGPAALRIGIFGLGAERPGGLSHPRGGWGRDSYNGLLLGADPDPVDTAADLDAIAQPGPDLIATAGYICTRLAQSFGVAELGQFSDDGRIRRRYVSDQHLRRLEAWAGDAVEFGDDVLE